MANIKSGHMDVEEIFHYVEDEVDAIDNCLFSDASLEHIDKAIEFLENLRNTIEDNL